MPPSARTATYRSSRPLDHLILVVIGTLSWWTLIYANGLWDLDFILRDVNVDDSFYYFKISKNMAQGLFSTFDGINRTNGYHPLWMWVCVPLYTLFSDIQALYAIKLLEVALLASAAAALARIFLPENARVRNFALYWAAAFVSLLSFPHSFLGLESAMTLFVVSHFFRYFHLFVTGARSSQLPVLGLAMLIPWARLEALVVVPALLGFVVFFSGSSRFWLRRTFPILTVLVISLALYGATNTLLFGGAVPVSGTIKALWGQDFWLRQGGYSFASSARQLWANPFLRESLLASLLAAALAPVGLAASRQILSIRAHDFLVPWGGVFALSAYAIARTCYSLTRSAPHWSTYSWYYPGVPLMMASLTLAGLRFLFWAGRSFPIWRRRFSTSLATLAVAASWVALEHTNTLRGIGEFKRWRVAHQKKIVDWEISSYQATLWANTHLPATAVIGSKDAGVVGYFSTHRVINLDGLVNSYEFFHLWKEGDLVDWMKNLGITHLINGSGLASSSSSTPCNHLLHKNKLFFAPPISCTQLHRGPKFVYSSRRVAMSTGVFQINHG